MLSREFRTAEELGIEPDVYDALVAFTREEDVQRFDMRWCSHCTLLAAETAPLSAHRSGGKTGGANE